MVQETVYIRFKTKLSCKSFNHIGNKKGTKKSEQKEPKSNGKPHCIQ